MASAHTQQNAGYIITMTTTPVKQNDAVKWHTALTTWGQIAAVIITLITVIGGNIVSVQVHLSRLDDKVESNKVLLDQRVNAISDKLNTLDTSLTSMDNRLRDLTSAQQREDGKLDSLILLSKRNSSN